MRVALHGTDQSAGTSIWFSLWTVAIVDIYFHFHYLISWTEFTLVPTNWLLLIHKRTKVDMKR